MKRKAVGKRVDTPAPKKNKIRLWLDRDVAQFFKSLENYEETINRILREHVDSQAVGK